MILRRIIEHVKTQNWTAVALDFVIVVMGVFIAMQVQALAVERNRQKSERAYLARLHGEVEQLIATRERYDHSRSKFSADLIAAVDLLDGEAADITLSPDQCDAIAGSAHTTVPPADMPTVTELLSTGRLDQLTAPAVRVAILTYMQEAARAHDLIMVITESGRDLGKAYPHLITHHLGLSRSVYDDVWLNPDCRADAMRADPAFRNELSENAYMYSVYANRAVLPVSAKLAALHEAIDAEIGADHAQTEPKQP